jgi:protein TonB
MNSFRAALAMLLLSTVCGFGQELKKLTHNEALNAVTSRVEPAYPAIARQLKVEGSVELEAVVTESGSVEQVKIVSGNAILTPPAAAALKQWKFKPFTADGKPVKAAAPITFNFHLGN